MVPVAVDAAVTIVEDTVKGLVRVLVKDNAEVVVAAKERVKEAVCMVVKEAMNINCH